MPEKLILRKWKPLCVGISMERHSESLDVMILELKNSNEHCEKVGFAVGIEMFGTSGLLILKLALLKNETKEVKILSICLSVLSKLHCNKINSNKHQSA